MSELPLLVNDLALILIVAGITTILFKRLKQPLVLGYIVAGFLAGPHVPYLPTVADVDSVKTWSEIGVIFLMFTLGLEFSFKKIVKMGVGPIIAACTVMVSMIGVGSFVGQMFGWSTMDSVFLGGMLAMSSTTIIYKAFDDLGLRHKKFAGEVLSVLILEDILGILLMVVLSALAVSQRFEGLQLAGSLLTLGFFLILWFVVGVFVVPILLRRNRKWMTPETLLVVSVGLCFLLVVMAAHAGYSAAFGAFMMGSILAETVEAEHIEHVVSPLKDLFGAIFFVSVGMLVDPTVLVQFWFPVAIITLSILVGQMLFGTFSFVLSGQPLDVAMRCGFSLAQIGEFAFIIAAMGVGLGVTSSFLYPVVVAVSIITTFLTPYMIKAAVPVYKHLAGVLPQRILVQRSQSASHRSFQPSHSPWHSLLRALVANSVAYSVVAIAVLTISLSAILPICRSIIGHYPGNVVCGVFTIIVVAPLLRPVVMKKNHSEEFKIIGQRGALQRVLLCVTLLVRYSIAVYVVYWVLDYLSPYRWYYHLAAASVIVAFIVYSRLVKMWSIRLERTFLQNLRSREVKKRAETISRPGYAGRLEARDLHIARLEMPADTLWAGKSLRQLGFGHDGVMVASIIRGQKRINIPDANTIIYATDSLEVIGDDASLETFGQRMQTEVSHQPLPSAAPLTLRRITIAEGTPLVGKNLAESGIRDKYHCMVVGFENESGSIEMASADRIIQVRDVIWMVGEDSQLRRIKRTNSGGK